MIISPEERNQILLASREELRDVDIHYGRIQHYRDVVKHIYSQAVQCQNFLLKDEIRQIEMRPVQMKDRETIKEKILRKRAEIWKGVGPDAAKNYGFNSVTDIIGLKIICGYLSDQPAIERWINETFNIIDKDSIEYSRGYKAWHYIVTLKEEIKKIGAPATWVNVPCEIQVKTLLQAAWDEKTHDLVYKKGDVSDFEKYQFALLSESLHVADKQSEMIRLEIEEARKEEQVRRHAALRVYFASSSKTAESIGFEIKEGIPNDQLKEMIGRMNLKAEEISQSQNFATSQKEKVELLTLGVRLTLETLNPEAETWTLDYAGQLLNSYSDDPYICRAVSSAYWALGFQYESLEAVVKAIENAERKNNDVEKNFGIRGLVHFIADYGRRDLRDLGERLLTELKNNSADLETKGFFLIKMGRSEAEIEKGIAFLHASLRLAQESGDENLKKITEMFCELDHSIAARKRKGILVAEKIGSLLKV